MASTHDVEMGNSPTPQSTDGGGVHDSTSREQKVCDAILTNNWDAFEVALRDYGDENEVFALRLNKEGLTPLLMAMTINNTQIDFIKKMIEEMPEELLQLTDYRGNTALHLWDRRQNNQTEKDIAQLLLKRCHYLRNLQNVDRKLPQLKGVDIPWSIEGDQAMEWEVVRDAIDKGKWNTIEKLFAQNKKKYAICRPIHAQSITPLHYAITLGRHLCHVHKMIDLIPRELLALTDGKGTTVLHLVANNRDRRYAQLAKKIVLKSPNLLCYVDNRNFSAIRVAIEGRNRPMVECLLYAAMMLNSEWQLNPLNDNATSYEIYEHLLRAEFYDLATDLLYFNKDIASKYNCLDSLMKNLLTDESYSSPTASARIKVTVKLLVRRICRTMFYYFMPDGIENKLGNPFLLAARNGYGDIVLEILEIYRPVIGFKDEHNRSAFQLAVIHRHLEVFSTLYDFASYHCHYKTLESLLCLEELDTGKNILHLAADKPSEELGHSGPFLQMPNEIRWFKELEKLLPVEERRKPNKERKTPRVCFMENHKEMIKEELGLVTSAAGACLTAATVIVSIAFASSIQIPGGTSENKKGKPNYADKAAFSLFGASNALALFFSLTGVLLLLSVFTSRFDANDSIAALPSKLVHALIALIVAVISLMIAFASAVFLVFANENPIFIGPSIVFIAVPVIFYAYQQTSTLINIFKSSRPTFRWA